MAAETVTLSCARIGGGGLVAIDQLARIKLGARRAGCEVRLIEASDELAALIELAGLGAVLGVEVKRKPEEREQPCCVQEEGELPDPPA